MRTTPIRITLAAACLLGAAACDDSPTAGGLEGTLRAIRGATDDFQVESAAVAAGYAPAGPCVAHPTLGAMGFHYARNALVDATVNPREPEALLYAPTPAGGRTLVGVEFVVQADAWDAQNAAPPTLAGQAFDDHRDPAARHGLPFAHYDLHVWAWQDNPSGVFAPFNPTVSCPAAAASLHAHH
ncbi:MAG TPA: hypothetical protein VFQ45_15120 [Longimicrobium sp.]|nr:hypothetical protein [Longimicrobium sp.]